MAETVQSSLVGLDAHDLVTSRGSSLKSEGAKTEQPGQDIREDAALVSVQDADLEGTEMSKRKREPITWTGPKDGATSPGRTECVTKGEESSPKRLKPNPKFLQSYLNGLEKLNQRRIAETASSAACKEITAVAASGAKVQFDRIPVEESLKFRKTALNIAKQQNFANCVALLKEVAVHYGFALCIETEEEREEAKARASADELSEEDQRDPRLLQPLFVSLRSDLEDHTVLDHRQRPALPLSSKQSKPVSVVPSTHSRLANSALAAITGQSQGSARRLRGPAKPKEAVPNPQPAPASDKAEEPNGTANTLDSEHSVQSDDQSEPDGSSEAGSQNDSREDVAGENHEVDKSEETSDQEWEPPEASGQGKSALHSTQGETQGTTPARKSKIRSLFSSANPQKRQQSRTLFGAALNGLK